MKYQDLYQFFVILLACVVLLGLGVFFYREIFPEYKVYQATYKDLEKFRSTYTHQEPAPFSMGIKQILIPDSNNGPEVIDRCISCHVAVDLPHFSPTRVAQDANGNSILEENPDYVWKKLDDEIAELSKTGRGAQAEKLMGLKTRTIDGKDVDMTKVLKMHPLIGTETRPFEFHSTDTYGCTSCHSGNGRTLVAKRAHGPVYDDEYEKAYNTPKPQFTEKDPENDPKFACMYNDKPGHGFVFQTTPILAGPLIAAKCVQCHNSISNMPADVDILMDGYAKGKELFISQGCYGCHRIAAFSRASVGPELTKAGLSYPWYIKESIVWPQADLSSSTMPNYHLDHEEVGNLMTFLMAQTGDTKAVSEIDYQISIKEWEAGKKMPWEMPVLPSDIHDVRKGMLIFAHEGCAACHKLQGFQSNDGFAIETNPNVKIKELVQAREWFRNFIPEHVMGSEIVEIVEAHKEEIDTHLAKDVRKGGILEEIEEKYPDLVMSFYTNFKYAMRAKNAEYKQDPKKLEVYQKRLHLVLMAYIQEYGLGRDIAPHLNWSGVYRNNAWLLGHFHNPSAYTARSIMPVMPFDDTKFYMLSNMLHVLGRENRNRLKEIWQVQGFTPPLAYEILCSQCHGEYRQGNGLIAEWIYPIPKNLRNPIFLRSLTKERAIDSITHGVKGTPMPPWGETISRDEVGDQIPVLSQFEVMELTNWLYQGIPPDVFVEEKEATQKWRYSPDDVVEEMKNERNFLLPESPLNAGSYFEERPNLDEGIDQTLYYIREKYYTKENLEQGQQFFLVNCAICHGKEGTGAGLRASSMVEAKPRMLTNVPWIRTRDDLRLLRSIKYGVSGTAMIPWGDQTSSLQRMQLVMFIRSLSASQVLRDSLEDTLYEIFDYSEEMVEEARKTEYDKLQKDKNSLLDAEKALLKLSQEDQISSREVADIYMQKIDLQRDLAKREKVDDLFKELIRLIEEERQIYKTVGEQFISPEIPPLFAEHFLAQVKNTPLFYSVQKGKLLQEFSDEKEKRADEFLQLLGNELQGKIDEHQKQTERAYINLKTKLFIQMKDAKVKREQQMDIYKRIYGESHL